VCQDPSKLREQITVCSCGKSRGVESNVCADSSVPLTSGFTCSLPYLKCEYAG
jgi:hypothetical protein